MSTTKNILVFATVILIGAAGIIFYLYNKPAIDIKDAPGEKVLATDLYRTFTKDSAAAKKIYLNKILEVSGTVTSYSKNQQHQPLVLLKTNTDGAAVNCTIEGSIGKISKEDVITVKGICNGMGEGDADLGIMGDVYLVRCHIIQ